MKTGDTVQLRSSHFATVKGGCYNTYMVVSGQLIYTRWYTSDLRHRFDTSLDVVELNGNEVIRVERTTKETITNMVEIGRQLNMI